MKDNPQRTAPPEYDAETQDFNDLPLVIRLDAIKLASERRIAVAIALADAIVESDAYSSWLRQLVQSDVSDASVGRAAREIVCKYVAQCAEANQESLLCAD